MVGKGTPLVFTPSLVKNTSPWSGAVMPMIMRMMVVFPAPLGPRTPRILPWGAENDTLSTTAVEPYTFRIPCTCRPSMLSSFAVSQSHSLLYHECSMFVKKHPIKVQKGHGQSHAPKTKVYSTRIVKSAKT